MDFKKFGTGCSPGGVLEYKKATVAQTQTLLFSVRANTEALWAQARTAEY